MLPARCDLALSSEIGQEGVFYGSLVTVANIAKVLPGATLGLVGGAVADALPRRVALGVGYVLQAVFCVVLPLVFGTGFGVLLILVLIVSTLNQLIGPSEKSVIPLVSSREEISSAASILSLSDSLAAGLGMAVFAPIVLVAFGVKALFIVCGGFLVFAAVRIFALPVRKHITVKDALQKLDLTELDLGFRSALRWLMG